MSNYRKNSLGNTLNQLGNQALDFIENNATKDVFDATEEISTAFKLKKTAGTVGHNDETDALRHALLSAKYTLSTNGYVAMGITDLHEIEGNMRHKQDPREENMDKWNNAVGRQVAHELKQEFGNKLNKMDKQVVNALLAQKIVKHIKSGDMITDVNDKRDFKSSIYNGRVYTPQTVGKMSTEEFGSHNKYVKIGDKNFMTDVEAQNAVNSGGMEFVSGYTKDDGTKVSSYYRKKRN